jgi:hypothetical protein
MPVPDRPQRKNIRILLGILLLALLLVILMLKKYAGRHPGEIPPLPVAPQEGVRLVTLFFAAPGGEGLVSESREIGPCGETASCAEALLEELINGPLDDLSPTLPETSTFHDVSLDGDTLIVNFGQEFLEGVPSGSNAEMMAVYSVVNSMTLNFPQARKVRLLIDGKGVETLKGHLDLREAIEPDFTLEKKKTGAGEQPPKRDRQ